MALAEAPRCAPAGLPKVGKAAACAASHLAEGIPPSPPGWESRARGLLSAPCLEDPTSTRSSRSKCMRGGLATHGDPRPPSHGKKKNVCAGRLSRRPLDAARYALLVSFRKCTSQGMEVYEKSEFVKAARNHTAGRENHTARGNSTRTITQQHRKITQQRGREMYGTACLDVRFCRKKGSPKSAFRAASKWFHVRQLLDVPSVATMRFWLTRF